MTSPDLPALIAIARDVLGETLHGPVPMRTVARLAEAVLAQHAECSRLQERVRVLGAALRVVYRGWHERSDEGEVSNWPMTDQAMAFARAALEGIEVK